MVHPLNAQSPEVQVRVFIHEASPQHTDIHTRTNALPSIKNNLKNCLKIALIRWVLRQKSSFYLFLDHLLDRFLVTFSRYTNNFIAKAIPSRSIDVHILRNNCL